MRFGVLVYHAMGYKCHLIDVFLIHFRLSEFYSIQDGERLCFFKEPNTLSHMKYLVVITDCNSIQWAIIDAKI